MRAYSLNKHITTIIFICIVVLATAIRLYKISSPVGDWHSWRQSDTAAVARNFLTFGFDPLRPRYDDLSNIQSGKDNPQGWRMVEYPLYQSLALVGHRIFSQFSIEVWLRLVTIFASVGTGIFLYKIFSITHDRYIGLLTFFVYAVLPFSVFYGRAILPDTLSVFFAFASLYLLFDQENNKRTWINLIISGFFSGLSVLVKPTGLFLLLPSFYLIYKLNKNLKSTLLMFFLYAVITLLPIAWWREWILQFPEGIPAYDWLFNKDGIRFKGAWFFWLFADRIGRLITGYWGLIFLGIGLLNRLKSNYSWFLKWLIIGCLTYFSVIAGGNVQHDYYQIIILPVICSLISLGIFEIIRSGRYPLTASIPFVLIISFFMLSFSWYTIRSYYWVNRSDLISAGNAANELLPRDAKVIAPNNGDTTFLYMIGRQGWPIGFDIDKKISMGATHYVTVSIAGDYETLELAQKYNVLASNDTFMIIELK